MGSSGEDEGEFDVIVVGAGIMGSCAAYELAKRGRKTLVLERFDLFHHLGSSHGESRTIRATYPEPYYPPLVFQSAQLWAQAQSEIGYKVLTETRHLDMGPAHNKSFQAIISSCQAHSIPIRFLNPAQLDQTFSGVFRLPKGWTAVETELGGIIKPTKAVAMFQTLALRHGAVLRDRTEVTGVERDGGTGRLQVSTAAGSRYRADKVVLTAGAWIQKLVKSVSGNGGKEGFNLPVQPLHTTICYWKVKEGFEDKLSPEAGFPTFASYGEPYIYGTPVLDFPGLIKVAQHGGRPCDPDKRDWEGKVDVESVRHWIEQVMGVCVEAAGGPVKTQACMYSMTPDEDYVIDYLGGELGEDVMVAGGFSGHGFKMGPVVGRMVAEMVVEGRVEGVDMRHFRIGRFQEDPRGNAKEHEDQVNFNAIGNSKL